MPNKFDRVQVWRFGRRNPPVDVVFFHEGFGSIVGVFGVVVLLKPKKVCQTNGSNPLVAEFQPFNLLCFSDSLTVLN